MTDQIQTQPLWLAQVRQAQVEAEAAHLEQIAREAAVRTERERLEREKALEEFTISLRSVLGHDAANELLGGPEGKATELFVQSGDYTFRAKSPGRGRRSVSLARNAPVVEDVTYFIEVVRLVPADVRGFLNDRALWCQEEVGGSYASDIPSLISAVNEADGQYRRIMDDYTKEKAWLGQRQREAERFHAPVKFAEAPPKPELDSDTQNTLAFLRELTTRIENGAPLLQLQRTALENIRFWLKIDPDQILW